MGRASAAEEQRGGRGGRRRARRERDARENALGIQVLMTRHRVSARSSNEEGGRSNAPRWRWLKAGCLSSFHLCLVPPRLSRTSFRTERGLEALSSSSPSTRDARIPTEKPRSGSSPLDVSPITFPRHVGSSNRFVRRRGTDFGRIRKSILSPSRCLL